MTDSSNDKNSNSIPTIPPFLKQSRFGKPNFGGNMGNVNNGLAKGQSAGVKQIRITQHKGGN